MSDPVVAVVMLFALAVAVLATFMALFNALTDLQIFYS